MRGPLTLETLRTDEKVDHATALFQLQVSGPAHPLKLKPPT